MWKCVRRQKGTVCGKQPLGMVLSADKPLCAGCDKPSRDKKPRGCGHVIKRDGAGKASCAICDKRLKSEDKKPKGCDKASICGEKDNGKCKMDRACPFYAWLPYPNKGVVRGGRDDDSLDHVKAGLARCRANTALRIGLKLHPCAKCGGMRASRQGGLCASCGRAAIDKIKAKRTSITLCIMPGCLNKTKVGEPVCKKCLRKAAAEEAVEGLRLITECKHPRAFAMPVFAQDFSHGAEPLAGGKLKSRGVMTIMQKWACPDCVGFAWKRLPTLLPDGSLWPDYGEKSQMVETMTFLKYGEPGARRREMYDKVVALDKAGSGLSAKKGMDKASKTLKRCLRG